MNEQLNWNQMKKEQRLQHQLFLQSQQIERVFSDHRLSAQVSGGQVAGQAIRFDLVARLEQGWDKLRQLKQDLLAALGVADLQWVREQDGLGLLVKRPVDPEVALLDLWPLLPELPPLTAVLGRDAGGHPLLVQLAADDVSHMLLCGGSAAGKSALLRTILLSLAMGNRQSQCQLLVIDPRLPERPAGKQLKPAAYLPHLLAPPAQKLAEILQIFSFLQEELAFRQEYGHQIPSLVVAVESVVSLMNWGGEEVVTPLKKLLHEGAAAGIHLVLTTRQTRSPLLNHAFKANIPLWIYGAAGGEEQDSVPGASELLGEGDFLAVVDGRQAQFQAAYIGSYDSHLVLDRLRQHRPRPVLAHPLDACDEEAEGEMDINLIGTAADDDAKIEKRNSKAVVKDPVQ